MTAPAKTPDIDDLARAIGAAWRRGVEAILETGGLLAEARAALADDDWVALTARLPFGPAHARRLVRIGRCDWLRTHVCALPSDIETLDKLVALSDERRAELIADDAIHPAMARGALDTLVKQEARAAKERDLGASTRAANRAFGAASGFNIYNVIYADPPWKEVVYSDATGRNKSPANHYPLMETAAIAAMPVPSIAHADCALFLWARVPMTEDAHEVMAAWGFAFKSEFVWVKPKISTGYWNRNRHEKLLVGTRGNIPAPAQGTQVESVFKDCTFASGVARGKPHLGAHSEKPLEARRMIERYYPSLPKIELFARPGVGQGRPGQREEAPAAAAGWDLWGNQV